MLAGNCSIFSVLVLGKLLLVLLAVKLRPASDLRFILPSDLGSEWPEEVL